MAPVYDREIQVPRLRVTGCETRSFTWNPTVGSAVVSAFQRGLLPGARKVRWWIHRPSATWRVQVAATSFDSVTALVRSTCAEFDFATAR